jgi:hypothetical protein
MARRPSPLVVTIGSPFDHTFRVRPEPWEDFTAPDGYAGGLDTGDAFEVTVGTPYTFEGSTVFDVDVHLDGATTADLAEGLANFELHAIVDGIGAVPWVDGPVILREPS